MSGNRITRRLATIPAVGAGAVLATLALPVWLPVLAVADLVRAPHRLRRAKVGLFGLSQLWMEVAAIVLAGGLWAVTGFGLATRGARSIGWHTSVQRWWVRTVRGRMENLLDLRVNATGVEKVAPGPLILMARHATLVDAMLPAMALTDSDMRLHYVMKRELESVPSLDLFGHRLDNHFVDRSGADTGAELRALERLGGCLNEGSAVVIFPEGTRFSASRLEREQARLAEQNPDRAARVSGLRRVLPPHSAGVMALRRGAPDADIGLLLHHGLDGMRDLRGLWRRLPLTAPVTVEVRRFRRSEVPTEPAAFLVWLDQRWAEVDAWVAAADAGSAPGS